MNWTLLGIVSKLIYLVGSAAVIGGSLSAFLLRDSHKNLNNHILSYVVIGGLAGALASALNFFGQVGEINNAGIKGMLDWSMTQLLADSGIGIATTIRGAGLLLATTMAFLLMKLGASQGHSVTQRFFVLIAFLAIAGQVVASSSLIGHVSPLSLEYRILLSLHVLCVLAWTGSLFPLWLACGQSKSLYLHKVMTSYGNVAVWVVVMLLISGGLITARLISGVDEFLTSTYGRGLVIKFLGVGLLLLLAARHKFNLVPPLASGSNAVQLRRSIAMECAIAFLVLIVTAYITTAVGPTMTH